MSAGKRPPKRSAGFSKLVLIVGVWAVVVLGEGGDIGYTMLFSKEKEKKSSKRLKSESKEKRSRKPSEDAAEVRSKSALPLEPFLVNLADTPQNRYARITVKLGLSLPPDQVVEKIAKNDVVISKIRDEVLSLLCTKRSDEIMTEEGKRTLRKEILERTSKALPEGSVEEVFFTDFVVQL